VQGKRRLVTQVLPGAIVWLGLGACVADGHPLGSDGTVAIEVVVDGPLFATDTLDENGQPKGPRQVPFQTDVVLRMVEDTEVAHGGLVQVRVQPPEALVLGPALDTTSDGAFDESGTEPTCNLVDGAFQCRGNSEGAARFSVTSPADWAGEAEVVISYANQTPSVSIPIQPAGLPPNATNFELIGLGDEEEIRPTFLALSCTIDALPEDLGDKWPTGRTRSREVYVRGTPPALSPSVAEHAPVILESLSSEGALSLTEDCAERVTRLRVVLDANGESSRFFACFSDLGGEIDLVATSGQKALERRVLVSPEPRLLRVRVRDGASQLTLGDPTTDVFEVSAFDVRLTAVSMDVDLTTTGVMGALLLETNSATTAPQNAEPISIGATPSAEGVARLVVTPRLLAQPACESAPIDVVP
jgi:hypothetical protein